MKFLILLLTCLSTTEALAQTSYVPTPRTLGSGGHQVGIYNDFFTTSKTINENGDSHTLSKDESFERFQSEIFGQYGATNELQFGLGARLRHNSSSYLDGLGTQVDATGSGLESTSFMIMYAFAPVGRLQYTLEGLFRFRPFTNDSKVTSSPEDLIIGEQGNELSGGLGVTYSSAANYLLTGRAGLRRPGSDLSDEIYWQVEGALPFRYLALVLGVEGVSSMNNDPFDSAPAEKPVYNAGASELYNGINREAITPYAGLNFALGTSWRLELRGGQAISGNSTDLGTTFGVNLVRRVDTPKDKPDATFKDYDLEASITRVSPKKEFVVIDKGLASDIEKGMKIDFFESDFLGGNILLARGVVIQVRADSCTVKITQRFNASKELKEGQVARGSVR